MLQLFYSATFVEMTPAAQTNVEFYAMAHFFLKKKLPLFIKNYPPLKKKIKILNAVAAIETCVLQINLVVF